MNNFSWSDFRDFADEVKYSSRFIYSDKVRKFLSAIKDSLPTRTKCFPKGTVMFRSQLGFDAHYEEDGLYTTGYSEERMKVSAN